jgi:hypothetical protein
MRATAVAHPSAAVSRSGGRAAALAPGRTRARTVIGSPPPAAAAFLVAAVLVAAVRGLVPFAHGWWLVSYLVLVGGISQWLLGGAPGPPWRRLYLLLVVFLAGSVVVGCLLADALPL